MMIKATHSPGPWVVEHLVASDCADGNAMTAICCATDADGKEGAILAQVNRWSYGDDPPNPESEANAILIAACPTMFNALELIADHDPETCNGLTPRDCVEAMREIARTALAKARGQ